MSEGAEYPTGEEAATDGDSYDEGDDEADDGEAYPETGEEASADSELSGTSPILSLRL